MQITTVNDAHLSWPRVWMLGPWVLGACGFVIAMLVEAPRAGAQGIDPSTYADMRWRSIGPYRSGNIYSVSGIPGDPTTYYIGTPESGVWKTTDGGTLWTPIFDAEHVPSVGAVAVAPSNPRIVYVGTGDPTSWSFTPGHGVYRSTDAGATWRPVGLEGTRYITSLIVDPHNPNIILVGALGSRVFLGDTNSARGVYRSVDGGRTWHHTLFRDYFTGVATLAADANDLRVVYAALERAPFGISPAERKALPPLGTGIYKSVNGGATWQPIAGRGLPTSAQSFIVAVAPGTRGQRVYAEAQSTGRDATGLYRSDDGGRSWILATSQILSAGGGPMYVDPKNPDILYLMGTAMYRSTDGGRHVAAYKGSPGGDDPRDLWIDPTNPRRMLMGVDQGPTITVDGGETWTPWYNLPNGQFYHVSTDDHFPYRVCAAQQDSGTACVLSRSDFGAIRDNDWYPIGGFEDTYIVTDPLNPRWVYSQGWYSVLRRYDRETGQVAVVYSPSEDERFTGAPPLVFSPQDPHMLYMAAQHVLVSTDDARTWRRISPDLTANPRLDSAQRGARFRTAIETLAPSPVQDGELWVGSSNGLIQIRRNAEANWVNVTPPDLPQGFLEGNVSMIDPSHASAAVAYAAVGGLRADHPYIFRTADYGEHWQLIVDGLPPDARVTVVREDPADPNVLYAGTVMGAWVSFDRGDHWQSLQLNLPNTMVTDMVVHGNDLAISTYGRALWILDDLSPLRQARAVIAAPNAYLFHPDLAYRMRWDNIEDTPLPPEVPAGDNPPEGAIIDYYLKTPAGGPITLSVYDADNHLVRQYSSTPAPRDSVQPNIATYWLDSALVLPTSAGMHRIAWDLRFPLPAVINYSYFGDLLDYREYTLNTHAIKGKTPRVQPTGPLVVPGTYRMQLTVDGATYTQELVVVNDPRVTASQADLVAQLRLEQAMVSGLSVSFTEFAELQPLRAAIASAEAHLHGVADSAALLGSLRALDDEADSLSSHADSGFGPGNRALTRHLEDMESGDIAPTPSDVAATDAACRTIDAALAGFGRVVATDIPALNARLVTAHLSALPIPAVATAPSCHQSILAGG